MRGTTCLLVLGAVFLDGCGGGNNTSPDASSDSGVDTTDSPPDASCVDPTWTQDLANPYFPFQAFGGAVWNDPWVQKEGGTYRMWISNGAGPNGVSIYEATSPDGASWALASALDSPRLAPGPDAYDAVSVETPSVVKLGSTYHMFWTAVPDSTLIHYTVGHATSTDGVTWTKDAQPLITRPSDPADWGGLGVAEPGAVVVGDTLYLYFAMVRCRNGFNGTSCNGPEPIAERGIGLVTSTDGVTFTPANNPVVTQSATYAASLGYEGYSTPAPMARGGKIYLFYDLVHQEPEFRQVGLAYSVSDDGVTFTEAGTDIVVRDPQGWTAFEVRAPTAVDEGDHVSLWFAGNSGNNPQASGFAIGIGRATSALGCP